MPPRTDSQVTFPGRQIRCLLTHDYVLLRQGLRRLLEDEPGVEVVGEAGNAAECLRKAYELRPDVLVVDAETFGLPAAETEHLVARESSQTRIVFLSSQERTDAPLGGLRAGAQECAMRQTSSEELVQMVRNSGRDRTNHLEGYSRRDLQLPGETPVPTERALTAREREVLKLLAEGKTVRAAAAVLGLSSKTVDAHKFNLMRKLGIHNKAELVMWAIQRKVVKVPANF